MSESDDKPLLAQILSAYLSNNSVTPADLPVVIASVRKAFSGSSEPGATSEEEISAARTREPVVPIKKSVTPEAITCLICGEKFKSLKRHLQSAHQLTPDAYREAFKLKADYPIVAPAYAEQRSALAKSLGLGRKKVIEKAPAKKGPAKRVPGKVANAA